MGNISLSYYSLLRNDVAIRMTLGILCTFNIPLYSISANQNAAAITNQGNSCQCVIFRFDDIRNGYLEKVQIALMNFFILKNESISLGVVMNQTHTDTDLFKKINEGYRKGLFELGIHGWNHVDYTKLTENKQRLSLLKANQKLYSLFGNYSRIFVPPFNLFNNSTLSAMQDSHISIISSAIYYDEPDTLSYIRHSTESMNAGIIHMPEMSDFSIYYNRTWVKAPIKFILGDIDFDVKTYGYSVIMVHPHNFAVQVNGSLVDKVDNNQIYSLSSIINAIKHKNIRIMTFSQVAGINGSRI